jgi:hypothetical protein
VKTELHFTWGTEIPFIAAQQMKQHKERGHKNTLTGTGLNFNTFNSSQ